MRIILDKNYVYSLSKYIVSSVRTRPKNVRDSKPRDDQKWRRQNNAGKRSTRSRGARQTRSGEGGREGRGSGI